MGPEELLVTVYDRNQEKGALLFPTQVPSVKTKCRVFTVNVFGFDAVKDIYQHSPINRATKYSLDGPSNII